MQNMEPDFKSILLRRETVKNDIVTIDSMKKK